MQLLSNPSASRRDRRRRGERGARLLAAILFGLAAMFFPQTSAEAHSFLESSVPAKDSSIDAGPAKIVLTFNEPLDSGFTELTVLGPDGATHWEAAAATVAGAALSAPVKPLGPAGKYTVDYRIVSADGHPVSGSYSFTLTKPGTGVAAAAAAAPPAPPSTAAASAARENDGSGDVPPWVWVAAAAVLLIAGGIVAARISHGPSSD
ncbi:copper resistance protein CopC [Amycolatopsis echigonensis]|uniref:Copper resistance protein CopC n=2 Tax=Amycolatopsis echigonensis TaxID=2576905 RepID=A0A8E1WA77_9PSEU|nr:copper resistance protein CopC [Amycolatopsis echigonensis]